MPKDKPRYQAANEKTITTLLRQARSTKKEMDSLGGALREKIAYAADKNHLHTKAFSLLRQLDRMEPEKLLEYWTHLQLYMDHAGLTKRMDDVSKLPLDENTEGEDAGEPTSDKVSRPRFGKPPKAGPSVASPSVQAAE